MKKRITAKILILIIISAAIVGCYQRETPKSAIEVEEELCQSFLTYIVSTSTYEPYLSRKERTTDYEWYLSFCDTLVRDYGCQDVFNMNLIINREFALYLNTLVTNDIVSTKDINIVLLNSEENSKGILKTYSIDYTYVTELEKEFNLTDTYYITMKDGKIANAGRKPENPPAKKRKGIRRDFTNIVYTQKLDK